MTNQQTEFMTLYAHHKRLSNYCRSMARNRADADDLLNDSILAAYEQFDKLENRDRFAGYLSPLPATCLRNSYAGEIPWQYDEKEALMLEDFSTDTETRAELSIVMQKMELLPSLQREALILFHISDLPLEEIRNIQGGSLSAVKQRIKRGRERLMQLCTERQQTVITLFF